MMYRDLEIIFNSAMETIYNFINSIESNPITQLILFKKFQ